MTENIEAQLLEKLSAWLMTQPEWVALMALERPYRREAARLISKLLLNLPARQVTPTMNRSTRRKMLHALQRDVVSPKLRAVKGRRARQLAKQQKDAARYGRMAEERAEQLAYRDEILRADNMARQEEAQRQLVQHYVEQAELEEAQASLHKGSDLYNGIPVGFIETDEIATVEEVN
jgi:hypothetical protein